MRLAFAEAVDPLDWDARVALMAALLGRIGASLPLEVREQPPERYAAEYEGIVQAYVASLEAVNRLLRAL